MILILWQRKTPHIHGNEVALVRPCQTLTRALVTHTWKYGTLKTILGRKRDVIIGEKLLSETLGVQHKTQTKRA